MPSQRSQIVVPPRRQHVAPARVGVLGQELVGDVGAAAVLEHAEQERGAEEAGAEVVAAADDVLDETVEGGAA